MPAGFGDGGFRGAGERRDSVAWLRIVSGGGGRAIHAALLETSIRGKPLGFSFTGTGLRGTRAEPVRRSLAAALLRASATSPSLLFAAAEEVPGPLDAALPFGRISAPPRPAGEGAATGEGDPGTRLWWAAGPPVPGSAPAAILHEILRRDDPFEPLERAASALAEAFSDARVGELARLPGLRTMVTLPPREGGAWRGGARGAMPPAGASAPGAGADRGFADRLWGILALPRTPPALRPPDDPLEWHGELMPFQQDGVRALVAMDRLLLSDDMGLGKTVQAVAAMRILRARGEVGSCLVVAPAGILDQWRREIARWAPELGAIIIRGPAEDRAWQWRARKDVKLASYDVLRADAGLRARAPSGDGVWDLVVLDEAQRIKNRNETSEAAKGIPRLRSWALTGTPIENDEEELASIMEFVDHEEGSPRRRYRPGPALLLRHAKLQLRRKKVDVLEDLPPKLETKLTIPLHPDQRVSYDRVEREGIFYLRSLGAEVGVTHVLALLTRLKQICNADPRTGASSKLDAIRDRLRTLTAQGHRALVFSQYKSGASGVEAAARHLREFDPLVLTGDVAPEERSTVIDRFKRVEAHKVLIISLRAGGLGLNLQEASYVFHLDRWWNPAVERQAEDRAHRMGQSVKVHVIKYTCEDTIEERIDEILEGKQALFDRLVDDVSLDPSTRMSREELLGLFGLG